MLENSVENPLDSKGIKPVSPKGNQPWNSLEGLRLKLKLQYFGRLLEWADSFKKTLMWGKIEARGDGGSRGWVGWRISIDWMDIRLSKLLEIMTDRDFWHAWCSWGHEEPEITERLNNSEISIIGCQKMPSSVIPPSCSLTPFNLHRMWDVCYIFQIRNMWIKKFK